VGHFTITCVSQQDIYYLTQWLVNRAHVRTRTVSVGRSILAGETWK